MSNAGQQGPSRVQRVVGAFTIALGLGALPAACGDVGETAPDDEAVVTTEEGLTCITLRRGPAGGVVEDAQLASDPTDPSVANANFGTSIFLLSGVVGPGLRQGLLRFDLSSIPAGTVVSSATLGLFKQSSAGSGTVGVHRATAPWSESTVTWNSFGGAFDPAFAASFDPATVPNGSTGSVDLTALTQAWVSGAVPNHGLLIEQATGRATFGASDASAANPRPRLTVCYAPASCADGLQNGAETGVDCGGPCAPCSACANVVCAPLSPCHLAGVCNPATGLCSNPFAPFGAPCNDGNACTQSDACQFGMCVGANPVQCAPSDDCHLAGACDPTTGACSSPVAPDGTSCDDGDPCTTDACSMGVCAGSGSCATCTDGLQNQDETGVDCGGSLCPPCSSCNDAALNQDETDVDCGGAFCPPCASGLACLAASDCSSLVCLGGVCQSPSCTDGVINGAETDLDCGGSCAPCFDGEGCVLATDCTNLVCAGGICQPGTCADGVQNGNETGVDCGGVCAVPELCNGLDDDCNGLVDEGFGTVTCGVGACQVTLPVCVSGQLTACVPSPPGVEDCDGLYDENCDGQVDEGCSCVNGTTQTCYTGAPGTENIGVCAGGLQTCQGGQFGACSGDVTPGSEVCNGLDDDCNAAVDDGLGMLSCGVGACAVTVPSCANGVVQSCVPLPPGAEVCDGVDNDCNGVIDDGNPGGGGACTTGLPGVCSVGTAACAGGALICQNTGTPTAEVCDGLDNDCDGQTDEGNPGGGASCSTGQAGICGAGTTACLLGAVTCLGNLQASAEVCDGLDNDCDGQTDEGNPGGGGSCNTGLSGVCSAGTTACLAGAIACNQNIQSGSETCDGLDNDCDGQTDEALGTLTCGSGTCANTVQACVGGVSQTCSPLPNGTACDDGNVCTAGDTCQAGTCTPGPVGINVSLAAGSVSGAALTSLVDGVYLGEGTGWQSGSVWWSGLTPVVEIGLGGNISITGLTVQADNNDTYLVQYLNPLTNTWTSLWTVPTHPSAGLRTRTTTFAPVTASKLRVSAASGDNSYSLSEVAWSSGAAVSLGKPVTLVAGGVSGAALSTLTDGASLAEGTQWQTGSVWWSGLTPVIEVDLGGSYGLTGASVQADDNDTYVLQYLNPSTGVWSTLWNVPSASGGGLRTRTTSFAIVTASKLRFSATGGDNSYSVSEITVTHAKAVSLVAGSVSGAALSTLVDGAFQPEGTGWQSGSVWWNGTTPVIEVDLGGTLAISGATVQSDDNDTYLLQYFNPTTGAWATLWNVPSASGGGLRTRTTTFATVTASKLRYSATGGDNSYSITEIAVTGSSCGG